MDKSGIDDKKAIVLMLANPTLVKRPVFELGGNIVVGFKDGERQQVRDGG
jgi:arsenate reductase-like glutaredoxin family protein